MPDQVDWRALEHEASPNGAVGRLLRDQREARGLSLVDVEKSLRIRVAHLQAIEEGRFDLLPGAAYIPAFMRAYAVHVGLDPDKVMQAYHLSGAIPIKRPVAMPADFPIVERRAPIGLAVLTVLLAIGAGYAAWQYLPREQAQVAQKVPPVPDRLLAVRPADPPVAAPAEGAAPPAGPSSAEAGRTGSEPTGSEPTGSELKRAPGAPAAAVPANVWPGRRESVAPPTQIQTREVPLAPPVVVAVPAPPPPPAVLSAPTAGQAQAAQPPAPPEPPRAKPAPAAPVEEAARQVAQEVASAPPAIAPVRVDTPLKVRRNSWVELRAPNGDILAQTYVRAGESYTIPAGIAYRVIDAR